jgi:hypothetical protein
MENGQKMLHNMYRGEKLKWEDKITLFIQSYLYRTTNFWNLLELMKNEERQQWTNNLYILWT